MAPHSTDITLSLSSLHDTQNLAQALAQAVLQEPALRTILLRGPLACGKTTLTRALVAHMPGGELAEVSSPSFTVCNHYPTFPPIVHCDLYRVESRLPDELFEAWETEGSQSPLLIIEWAEFIPPRELPQEFLDILLQPCQEKRSVSIHAHGPRACCVSQRLLQGLRPQDDCQQLSEPFCCNMPL